MPMDANDGNYFLHGLVMMDIKGIVLGLNPSNEIHEDYVQIIYDDCHRSNEVAESFLASPDSLAKRCGVDQEAIDVKNECHGFADWRTGYVQTCEQYYLQDALSGELPVVVTGTAYQEQFGVRGAEGSSLLTLGNLDQFSFPTTKPMELTVPAHGAYRGQTHPVPEHGDGPPDRWHTVGRLAAGLQRGGVRRWTHGLS